MCTSKRDDRKLENTIKQSRFKHLGKLHKEWTEADAFQFKFKLVLFIVWRRAEIGFGLVLYRVPCQCRALAWPFIVINRKLCSAELE